MTEPFNMEVPWEELVNRGLNQKAQNLKPQIDKLLVQVVTDEVKKRFPKYKQHSAWHYTFIKWESTTEKYRLTIAPGLPTPKG